MTEAWSSKFDENGGKCLECGADNNSSEATVDEVRSSFVRHMAIDHDKIFDRLSVEIRQHMRSAFDDGSVALPPTPPPPATNPTDLNK